MAAAAPEPRPTSAEVSAFLLELHERANELGHVELQELALRRFGGIIPFDSGLLAMGTIQEVGTFVAYVCAACGYSEMYATGIDEIGALQRGEEGLR